MKMSSRQRHAIAAPKTKSTYPKKVSSPSSDPAPQYIIPHRRPLPLPLVTPGKALGLLILMDGDEANHLEFFLPRRRGDLYLVADLAIQQRFANRRSRRNVALFRVGFLAAHQLVFDLHFAVDVEHDDPRAIPGAVFRDIAEVEHAQVAHAPLQLPDARVDIALALLGEFVLRVFGKIAMRARHRDFLGELHAELVLERVELILNLLPDLAERVGHGLRLPVTPFQKCSRSPGLLDGSPDPA